MAEPAAIPKREQVVSVVGRVPVLRANRIKMAASETCLTHLRTLMLKDIHRVHNVRVCSS